MIMTFTIPLIETYNVILRMVETTETFSDADIFSLLNASNEANITESVQRSKTSTPVSKIMIPHNTESKTNDDPITT